MIPDLFINLLYIAAIAFRSILPSREFWELPDMMVSAMEGLGSLISKAAAVLPDNFLLHLAAALALVITVTIFVFPWLAARNFKLPFSRAIRD